MTDGQTECTNQVLEDKLGACILWFQGGWEEKLDLINFPTILETKLPFRYCHMKHCMEGSVGVQCVNMSLVRMLY